MPPSPARPLSSAVPTWVMDVPFEWRPHMASQGVVWDAALGESVYRGHQCPEHLAIFKAAPLSLGWHRQYRANGRHLEPLTRQEPSYIARAHQTVASAMMAAAHKSRAPGFLLADEVGVGKTMSAWDFALGAQSVRTILIVTTASAQAHWRMTVRHAGWRSDQTVLIINYDRLGKIFQVPEKGLTSNRLKGKRKRIAKQAEAPEFDLIVFDESHKGKNPTSARGLMMRKLEERAKFCIWASATAGQNPVELIYMAKLLAFRSGGRVPSTTIKEFGVWCASQGLKVSAGGFGKIVWDHNEADLTRMHEWLFGGTTPVGIRRLPQDVAGWPAMQRQLWPIDLDPAGRQAYATLWTDFVAQEMGVDRSDRKTASVQQEKNRMRLRQESSWLRVSQTARMADELVEQGKKVAISVAFRKTQDALVEQLRAMGHEVAAIFGGQGPTEQERQRLLFQDGPASIVVFTVEEAISLHQGQYVAASEDPARIMLVHDIRWSAIQMAQIEGRCHRDGQLAPVMWLAAADTVDMDIAQAMIDKVKGMKALHGDPVGDMAAIEAVLAQHLR